MTVDEIDIVNDNFVLCQDITDEYDFYGVGFYVEPSEDKRMSKDNLRVFKVVKLKGKSWSASGFEISIGDKVLSAALGMDILLDGIKYKIHELKYIIAKVED